MYNESWGSRLTLGHEVPVRCPDGYVRAGKVLDAEDEIFYRVEYMVKSTKAVASGWVDRLQFKVDA